MKAARLGFALLALTAASTASAQTRDDAAAAMPSAFCAARHERGAPAAPAHAVEVPISIEDGVIVVDAMLQGSGPYAMLLDTGAVETLTPRVAGALGLKPEGRTTFEGSAEHAMAVGVTHVSAAQIGDAALRAPQFLVVDLPPSIADRGPRPPLAGILGYQLFTNFVVRLDYQKGRLTLTNPADFHYEGPGECVPFVLRDRSPAILASADSVPGLFAIDTGSDNALILDHGFVGRNRLADKHPAVLNIVSAGVDGLAQNGVARIDRFGIAHTAVRRPLTLFSPQGDFPIAGVSGAIGSKILRQFVITFDYARQEIWFEKSPAFGGKMRGGATGFQAIKTVDKNFRVINVIAHTPAADVAMKPGDVITEVDGMSAGTLAPSDFSDLMNRPEGTHVHLSLAHEGEAHLVTITLRELVP